MGEKRRGGGGGMNGKATGQRERERERERESFWSQLSGSKCDHMIVIWLYWG